MIFSRLLIFALIAWAAGRASGAARNDVPRLPKNRDLFFAEDNLVYSRYLSLARDGSYRQLNQDRDATVEADQGAWEQDAATGAVLLHSTLRGLRFRALLSGPLSVLLDETANLDALPALAAAGHRLLEDSRAEVFAAADIGELPPVAVDRQAGAFSRADLAGLLAQVERTIQTEGTRTYRLAPLRLPGRPLLLALEGATFGPERAAQTCRDHAVPRGKVPPFYFAQVEAAEFARRVGVWRALEFPGGPSAP